MFSDLTTEVLAAALRGYDARNAAIANNIANAETPGYKRVDVSFESALAQAVEDDRAALGARRGGRSHEVSGFAATLRTVDTTALRADGSNVDPDDEMARMAANQLAHSTVTALLDKRFGQFRTAILGR